MAGLLHRVVRGDISIPPKTALQRYGDSQVVSSQEVKSSQLKITKCDADSPNVDNSRSPNNLAASQPSATARERHSLDLDDLDLCDSVRAPFLVALPEPSGGLLCPAHGHGWYWESRHDGRLHCVACWPEAPIGSMVARVWESADGGAAILVGCGFAPGQPVFMTRTDGAARWPWQDNNQPAEPAFV